MAETTPDSNAQEQNEELFVQLITMLFAGALQQMGKIMNPVTNDIEKNLELAKISIDMLSMLEEKTKGNLSAEEARFISDSLFQLRMNYVDEVKKSAEEAKEAPMKESEELSKQESAQPPKKQKKEAAKEAEQEET